MSYYHRKKDSLEQFFRKKAEEYEISYREEDWLKLKEKLEVRNIQRSYRNRVRWIAAASFLLISLISYFTYENHNRINQISRYFSTVTPEAQNNTSDGRFPAREGNQNSAGESGDADGNPVAAGEPGDTERNQTDAEVQGDRQGSSDTGEGETASERNPRDVTLDAYDDPITSTPPPRERDNRRRITAGEGPGSGFAAAVNEPVPLVTRFRRSSPAAISPPDIESVATVISVQEVPSLSGPADRADRPAASRISAGLVLASDMSTAGSMTNFYDPGYKAGLTVEYELAPGLAITTGLIQSKVRYAARGGEHAPAGYWTGVSPEETIGDCLILDIPVNLKYSFLNFSRSRLFITAGVSSYIMLNEKYQFRYGENDGELRQSWNGNTGTGHWMSNAGFSIGYEMDIHPNWSLRAEPFIRLPLKEVGWGNVKLYSVGSFVSLSYKFPGSG